MNIIDQLFEKVKHTQSAVLVGLDPILEHLPPQFIRPGVAGAAQALLDFNLEILESVYDLIPAVKLQMACYELYGAEGIKTFHATVHRAKALGLFVIDDSKRGDIGSTARLYAQARIGQAPVAGGLGPLSESDFVTVNPYLGSDGLDPFYQVALEQNKGVFVLVRTSNLSSAQYQTAQINGRALFEQIAIDVEAQARQSVGRHGYSSIGAVVGATWPEEAEKLRQLMPSVPFLVPGYGAQGGKGDDVVPCFDAQGLGALVNSSRGILFAYQTKKAEPRQFAHCAREAVQEMNLDISLALKRAGRLPQGG